MRNTSETNNALRKIHLFLEKAMCPALLNPPGGDEAMYSVDDHDGGGDDLSDFDSLFDEAMEETGHNMAIWKQDPARRSPPRPESPNFVPGLYLTWPTITLPPDLERQVVVDCLMSWFLNHPPRDQDPPLDLGSFLEACSFNNVNQIMLFNRADGIQQPTSSAWPPCLTRLLAHVSEALAPPTLDVRTWSTLFSFEPIQDPGSTASSPDGSQPTAKRSRQAIINLYHPGEGISDHIDLLDRYDDGIVGVSFLSGCVMRFGKPDQGQHRDPLSQPDPDYTNLYLPPRSVIAFVGDARYKWTHGIPSRRLDLVQDESGMHEGEKPSWLDRQLRLSVTFRWLLPGADTVGPAGNSD